MQHEIRSNCVYRNAEPIFAIERQDNMIALIPMAIYSNLLDEQARELK